jgi:serine/threonine protein kinase
LTNGALPIEQALRYAIEIADGLSAAHTAGITHRDIKPGNVMLTKGGAKLLDFGLARTRPRPGAARPDGGRGHSRNVPVHGARTDRGTRGGRTHGPLAFGAVLYEMLTGKKAFLGVRPLASPPLDHLVTRCLEKDRDQRWQTAADVMRELEWIVEQGRSDRQPKSIRQMQVATL